jgi:hypothetical protein
MSLFCERDGDIDNELEQKILTDQPEITHVEIGDTEWKSPLRLYERLGKALNNNTHVKALFINVRCVYEDEDLTPLLSFIQTSSSLQEVLLSGGLLHHMSGLDESTLLRFTNAISRNNNIQKIALNDLPIPVNAFIDMVRSVPSNLQHLEMYDVLFKNTEEPLVPSMIFETFSSLTKLSSVTLGFPCRAEINTTEVILAALFQNSNIKKLILLGEPCANENEETMERETWQLIVDFIRHSTSLKHVSFHGFYWTEEEDTEIVGEFPFDFGLIPGALQESDCVNEIAFGDCSFSTPTQILHFKSMLDSSYKPYTLILGEYIDFDGMLGNEHEDDEDEDTDMAVAMQFVGELVTNSPGLYQLDVREFHEDQEELPSRQAIFDALKEDTSAAVKSVLFGALSSQDFNDLVQSLPRFPHLREIQFDLTAEQAFSCQKALLFGSLFRNISLHRIDSSAPLAQKDMDDDSKEKEERIFLNMIGKRNQHLLDLLWDFSHENKFCTPIHFVPFLLENSLKVACPLHVRSSFQSLLRLDEHQRNSAVTNDG